MGTFGYCYILDYQNSSIIEIELDEQDENLEASDIINRRGYKESDVNYMFTEDKCKINSIK